MSTRIARIFPSLAAFLALSGCVPRGLEDPETTAWHGAPESPFVAGPYLVRTKPGEMAVVLKGRMLQPPVVEWWLPEDPGDLTPPPDGRRRIPARQHVSQWVALLQGLPVGPTLAYRVLSAAGNAGPHAFKAGAARGTRFTFGSFGDTRTGHAVHRAVIEALAAEHVDFVLHTGDMVESGGLAQEWDLFFRIERRVLSSAPIFPAIGNHDMGPRDLFGEVFLTTTWADSFAYYYQDWGDVRVVVVDTGVECADGCTQNLFARRALSEAAKQGKLLVLSLHYPPYSSGAHGSSLRTRKTVDALASEYGIELVLAGHDHHYERSKSIGGTYYVVSAAAGAPVRVVRPQWFTAAIRTEAHYTLVDVEPNRMTLRAVNLRGETFDQQVIEARPPRRRPSR